MKNWLLVACLLIVTSCSGVERNDAPVAQEAPAVRGDQYLVYVDRLDLHTKPTATSEVITTLAHDDIVTEIVEPDLYVTRDEAGQWWRFVRTGDRQGWVLDNNIIPMNLYTLFRAADEAGKSGNTKSMIAALKVATDKYKADAGYLDQDFRIFISPNKQNAIVSWGVMGESSDDDTYRWGSYPIESRLLVTPLILTFFTGTGLTSYSRNDCEPYIPQWSTDSEAVAIPWLGVAEFGTDLGALDIFTSRPWRHTSFQRVKWVITRYVEYLPQFDMAFCDHYFLWAQKTPVPEPGPKYLEHDSFIPELKMLNLTTGESVTLLTANTAHAKPAGSFRTPGGGNIKRYKVKMVRTTEPPSEVKRSKIFRKYLNSYQNAYDESEADVS